MNLKIIIPVIIILVLAGIVGALNVAKTQVPYTDQECSNVQVPYTAQECSNVQVPYAGQSCTAKPFTYNSPGTWTQYNRGIFTPDLATVTCTVNNLENQGGTFSVTYGFRINGVPITKTESVFIQAYSSTVLKDSYNGQVDTGLCSATPPTYQACQATTQYTTQTQCQDVTKYRTESQCKSVTKYRTVSLWKSMFG